MYDYQSFCTNAIEKLSIWKLGHLELFVPQPLLIDF